MSIPCFRETRWCLLAACCLAGLMDGRRVRAAAEFIKVHKGSIEAAAFSPDGKTLATGGGTRSFGKGAALGELKLIDVPTGKERATLAGHRAMVRALSFSPDGKLLASGGDIAIDPGGLRRLVGPVLVVWDMASRKAVARPEIASIAVEALAFSPDGKTLAAASTTRVHLLETGTFKEVRTLPIRAVRCLAWYPDSKTLVTGGGDKRVRLWNPATGTQKGGTVREGVVHCLTFSPDGKTLAIAAGTFITLWDPKRQVERMVRQAHKSEVLSLAFLPDGELLLSLAQGDEVSFRMWSVLNMTSWSSLKFQGRCLAVNRQGDIAIGGWVSSTVVLMRRGKK